jgi:hypothetical protein
MTAVARRKSPEGVATTELICGAAKGASDGLFPQILSLHVAPGSIVADVTYGKGVFWRQVEAGLYDVLATDIATGVDCRDLPHGDGDIDCVVLDPPFMEGLFRARRESLAGNGPHSNFRECHSNGTAVQEDGPKHHAAVLDLHFKAGVEAHGVLRDKGTLIVKCQDQVSANIQSLTHVQIINKYQGMGFYAKDLFVLMRNDRPGISRMLKQVHARKNHSHFLVFVKAAKPRSLWAWAYWTIGASRSMT